MEEKKEFTQGVHCLKCDGVYPEEKPIVKICPHCGNDDMMATVYLTESIEEYM